jgi:hypothetical protein
MKILKNILLVIVSIFIILLIIAAFLPSEFGVVRDVEIEQPKDVVFEYTKMLKNQDNFSSWASIDPNMKKEFSGVDGTVGFISAWDSENPDVGKGEQEIIAIDEGSRIDYQLRFIEPFESSSEAYMIFTSVDSNKTNVQWGFSGEMPYPMNLMLVFMDMEGQLGSDFSNGLNTLKWILEKE